jgi:serine/threonine-protein kinase
MELDDLKTAWRELDQRLERHNALNWRLVQELKRDRTQSALRPLTRLLVYELLSGIVAALLVGAFLGEHFRDPWYAIPAIVLHVVAVFTIGVAIWQLAWLGRIDYSAPVVAIQHDLAQLGTMRIRTTRWLLLLAPLLWTPLAIVAAQGLFGFDVYQEFGLAWVGANLAFGLAMIPLAIGITRRLAGRFAGSQWLEQLTDSIAGRSLAAARERLVEIAHFEEER